MVDDDEFDLENDDFLTETFLSIPDSELVGPAVSEHSAEFDCQQKCDVIAEQTEHSKRSSSFVDKQEKEDVKISALNSSCDEDEKLEKSILSTLVSSTPLAGTKKQNPHFLPSPVKELEDCSGSKDGVNCPLKDKKQTCNDFLKPNVIDKSVRSLQETVGNKSRHYDSNNSFANKVFSGVVSSAKKRKFSGPAGLLPATQDETLLKQPCSSRDARRSLMVSTYNINYQNIASSQYTPEALQCGPWKTLQADVSSCLHSFSSSQNFNIRQILLESSKKKMPKYMVIPILCILIKKINVKDLNAKSVFMDETGEINVKIDKEVMEKYAKEIVEGSAVILRNVTSLCNVLIVRCENLVSIYVADGTVKHIQDLDSVLESSAPDEGVVCDQLISPKVGGGNFLHSRSTRSSDTSDGRYKVPLKTLNPDCKNAFTSSKTNDSCVSSWAAKADSNQAVNESTPENENMDTSGCMDDFDELLGNLDETSFLDA